ncbi:MAG: methyltransferase domain-containing protein [Gemmatimonadota bacterium]|nr:methyltransferase domain-containing protein [Gemmatimonadota bacterium]
MSPVERVECPICEADDAEPWAVDHLGHRIVRCRGCGLRYQSPRPTGREALDIYDAEYFERERLGASRHRAIPGATSRHYLETIFRYCRTPRPDLLDIGTGLGQFARVAAKSAAVASVTATDVVDTHRETLREAGVDLLVGELGELELGRYDVVTAHHVLEHVDRPGALLRRIREAMRNTAIFHVVVPNEGGAMSRWKSFLSRHRLKRRAFRHLGAHHHLWFFERETLRRLLEKHGFVVVRAGTTSAAKRRSPPERLAHAALDAARWNTWLEFVATKRRQEER